MSQYVKIADKLEIFNETGKFIRLNAPAFFENPDFLEWLNKPQGKMTWHVPGEAPNEYSDVIVMIDSSLTGEGTDSDMPEEIWDQIVAIVKERFAPGSSLPIMVWISNLEI